MTATYRAARAGSTVYVRVVGLAGMRNAPVLDAFLESGRGQQVATVCIDLSDCLGMDSTFMGTIVGHAQALAEAHARLVIVRPGDKNRHLLAMLGVTEVVAVVDAGEPPAVAFQELDESQSVGTVERMELIQQAHQRLAALSEANAQKFSPFLKALEADLGRLRAKAM